jgi:YbgC/YbaW family acyl-CoA thioester hydrolase
MTTTTDGRAPAAHEVTYHVFPTDCDVFGHVNHATMITILEHARWALLETVISLRDVTRRDLWADGVWSVVRHVDIGYHWQSLPGDDLVIRSGLVGIGRTSYRIRQTVRHAATRRLHAEATITFVCLDQEGRPVPVPERWRTVFPVWGTGADDTASDDTASDDTASVETANR